MSVLLFVVVVVEAFELCILDDAVRPFGLTTVLRDTPVRHAIARIDSFYRKRMGPSMFRSPMSITPLPLSLTALGEGPHGLNLNGPCVHPALFWVKISIRGFLAIIHLPGASVTPHHICWLVSCGRSRRASGARAARESEQEPDPGPQVARPPGRGRTRSASSRHWGTRSRA